MPLRYSIIYDCCVRKCEELGICFDFDNNTHLQHPRTLDDIYVNLVYHSQNRSQGCAINFFKLMEDEMRREPAERILGIIRDYHFNLEDNFDYINLFERLKDDAYVSSSLSLEKGKDIQYLELAKTCQCIKKYISNYDSLDSFIRSHTFTNDADNNWRIIRRVANSIYNMSTELIPDFFKEQDCIVGRDFLVKADIHVKRFFKNIYQTELTDKGVYEKLLNLYNEADQETRENCPPYKLDKLIYLIGEHFGNPDDSNTFASMVLGTCNNI